LKLVRNIDEYNSKPLEAFSFTVNTLLCICFLLCAEHFQVNSKILETFFAPYVVRDSRQKRFVTNMQLKTTICQFPTEKNPEKVLSGFFHFKSVLKIQIFKILLQKIQIGNSGIQWIRGSQHFQA